MKCAVIGGGPMGLMAAYRLLQQGHQVTLFERDDRIGGMSASFDFDGTKIERYYHFVCKPDYPLFSLLDELKLLHTLVWKPTKMGFFYHGKLYPWGTPLGLLTFPHLSMSEKFRYALQILVTKRVTSWKGLDGQYAEKWIKRWIGERAYDVLWKPLFYYKFYEYANEPSAAWIGTRIKRVALSRKNIFQEEMGYIHGGSETLLKVMEERIRALGGVIKLSTPLQEIVISGDRIEGVRAGGTTESFDNIISTIPLPYLSKLIPGLPQEEKKKVEGIANVAVACVILKLKEQFTENFWLNINHPGIEIPGLIEYSNLNPLGSHILYAPFYMPASHPKYAREKEAFIDEVLQAMSMIKPGFSRSSVLSAHVHKYEFSQTVCPPDFYEKLPPMKSAVRGLYYADTSYYYPEDRSICESVVVGEKLAQEVTASVKEYQQQAA